MTSIVVTGAQGFLGRHAVRRFRELGAPVVPLTRSVPRDVSMQQVQRYQDYLPPADAVLVHLAEPAMIATAEDQGAAHVRAMVEQCCALLAHPWRHVVYASSGTVYGETVAEPRHSGEALTPGSAYATAKLECEAAVLAAGGTVARFANLFGRGMHAETVIPEILAQLGRPGPLRVRNARAIRDFLSVEDAAAGLQVLSQDPASRGALFNFGSGSGWRIEDIARHALRLAGEADREVVSTDLATRETCLVLDIRATLYALRWWPRLTLQHWLGDAVRERLGR